MITKYFTNIFIRFAPLGKEASTSRNFLQTLPPSLKATCKVDFKLLNTQDIAKGTKPSIKVTFKDSNIIDVDPTELKLTDLTNLFDRHSRKLQFEEDIKNL